MVGRDVPASRRTPREAGAPLLELRDVSVTAARAPLHHASLTVREGEIVGIAGVSGNGQAALADLVAGLARQASGDMRLYGAPVRAPDPARLCPRRHRPHPRRPPPRRHRRRHDGGRERRHRRGAPARFPARRLPERPAIRARAEAAIRDYDVRCPGPDAPSRLLSGGNIQKLILARVLDRNPRIVLANQPTRGLDIGAQPEVQRRLLDARERGAGILLISEDLDELMVLSDRIAVMHAGHLSEARPTERLDRGVLGLQMAGHHDADAAHGRRGLDGHPLRAPPVGAAGASGAGTRGRRPCSACARRHPAGARRSADPHRLRHDGQGRVRLPLRLHRDADPHHAADPHRARRRGRLPRQAVEHRGGGPALCRGAGRRRGRLRRHRRAGLGHGAAGARRRARSPARC
jgi:ABC-type dipeptide/oligopeptide/nickel transport system ATPase subunit